MRIATVIKFQNQYARGLALVTLDGETVFGTLDDCFGLYRCREWAPRNQIEIFGDHHKGAVAK